ncbi:PLDc N-terminal domain-containing protein [Nonomuraea ferruginea]
MAYSSGMAGVLIGLALLAFWLFSLFDVITTPEEEVQQSPKAVWLIIVAAVPIVGGVFLDDARPSQGRRRGTSGRR